MMKLNKLIISPNIRKWYSRLLLLLVFFFVCYYIFLNFSEIRRFKYDLEWIYLFYSILSFLISYLLQIFIWYRLASSFGLKASILPTAKCWSLSQLGKYIPGKVGLFLVRMDLYNHASKRVVAFATGVEFITSMTAAFIIILISIAFLPETIPAYIRSTAISFVIFFLLILYPPILKKISAIIFKFIHKEPLTELPTYGLLIKFVLANIIIGLPYGLGIYFAFNCFHHIGWNLFLTLTGVYFAASPVGVAAFFAPAGIGVREGFALLILQAFMAQPVVIFGTILTRFLITFVEIILAALFPMVEYFSKSGKSNL